MDFERKTTHLLNNNIINSNTARSYSSTFSDKWPTLANHIVALCQKSRIKEVKDFMKENESLVVEAGKIRTILNALISINLFTLKNIYY